MIELKSDGLQFSFPKVHKDARLRIEFQRTLRIPDDDRSYPLPPGLGAFPLRHVDDFTDNVPSRWIQHGGVMLPMYQSEAMWLNFHSPYVERHDTPYPFAIKVAAGKINAVTGEDWEEGLDHRPQDYMVSPEQPWLDGYCVEKGFIRQFVAMPLGSGYSAEEQITGKAEHGGLQIVVFPMKREAFERRFPKVSRLLRARAAMAPLACCAPEALAEEECEAGMGLAPGGRMEQEIYDDPYGIGEWDLGRPSRCFVHLSNSLVWRAATGEEPPTTPPTAKEYEAAGLPWFSYYAEAATAVDGSEKLKGLKSVAQLGKEKGDAPLPENKSVDPKNIQALRQGLKKGQVREGTF